jgi:DNA-binding NtrC family response regulator
VRDRLDRFAPMALPVLVEGAPGTGRSRAARYLHRASNPSGATLRQMDGSQVTREICAEISRPVRGARRGPSAETFLIDGIEQVPAEIQERLARALEDGLLAGGPRIVALLALDRGPPLLPVLRYALSALTVSMPSMTERQSDLPAIANALLSVLSARMRQTQPDLDTTAVALIERNAWPGNIQQMRSVLGAALAARRQEGPVTGKEIEAQLDRFRSMDRPRGGEDGSGLHAWIDRAVSAGDFSIAEFERHVYQAAIARTGGNLSAAARLVGLTRAQLSYRVGAQASDRTE